MFGFKRRLIKIITELKWYNSHFKAFYLRDNSIQKYMKSHRVKKLNLACWPHLKDGWLNTDLYGNEKVIPLNLTKKFPIKDSAFNYIFSEHAIEHFDVNRGREILKECYRILKSGGKIRLATPDIGFLVKLYNKQKSFTQKKYIKWAGETFLDNPKHYTDTFVINNFFRAWGHQFIYDYKTLKRLLEDVGFKNIQKASPGKSSDPQLKDMEMHWKSIGRKDFNNLETFVIEGTKI